MCVTAKATKRLDRFLTIFCTQFTLYKISVEFVNGQNHLNRFKMGRPFLIFKEVYVLNGELVLKTNHIKQKLVKLQNFDIFNYCHIPIVTKWQIIKEFKCIFD